MPSDMGRLADSALSFSKQTAAWDEELEGGKVVIATVEYDASITEGELAPRDVNGNIAWVQTIIVGIRKEILTTEPQPKTLLTFKGRPYKISAVWGHEPTDAMWEMRCLRFD